MKVSSRLTLPALWFASCLCAGSDPWASLKVGMTPEAATALLGQPLVKTRGHGLQTWIYDQGTEVLLRGNVEAWTSPVGTLPATPVSAPVAAIAPVKTTVQATAITPPRPSLSKDDFLPYFPVPGKVTPGGTDPRDPKPGSTIPKP